MFRTTQVIATLDKINISKMINSDKTKNKKEFFQIH